MKFRKDFGFDKLYVLIEKWVVYFIIIVLEVIVVWNKINWNLVEKGVFLMFVFKGKMEERFKYSNIVLL